MSPQPAPRHCHYLIKTGDLLGFGPTEVEIMASVARYHHGGRPRRKHPGYGELPRQSRRTVKVLAACVRLADALDRTHRQVVRTVVVEQRDGACRVSCTTNGEAELELMAAAHAKDLLEDVLGMAVRIERAALARSDADLVAS